MNSIVIYTRSMCGYCTAAKSLLSKKGVTFREIDGTFSPKIRQEMIQRSGRTTFPQIFVGDHHVGGYDELNSLERSGKLDPLLKGD